MQDEAKSREQLLAELFELRDRVSQLEKERVELKRAEDALREGEERLKTLLNHNPSLIFLKDEAGGYVYLNEAYEKKFVFRKDWYGKTDFDIWPRESAELFRANDAEVLRSGQMHQFLEDSTDLDGRRYCWLCYKFPFSDSRGKRYVGGIGIDATERVRAEEAMRESDARFRLAARAAHIMVYELDVRNKQVGAMHGLTDLLGYEPTEAEVSLEWWDHLIHPEDLERCHVAFEAMSEQLRDHTLHYRVRHKDGRTLWVEDHATSVFDSKGQWAQIVGTVQDITERKRTEEALRESEREFVAMFERAALGKSWADPETNRMLRVNQAFADMLGYSVDEMCRMTFVEITHPEDREQDLASYAHVRDGTANKWQIEKRYIRKDGSILWANVSGSIIRYEDGRPPRTIAVIQDITERKRMEEELRKSKNELDLRVQERTAELEKANEQLRRTPSLLIAAQEEERKRLASELHDSIGQTLAALKFRMEFILGGLRNGRVEEGIEAVEGFIPTLQRSIDETRAIYMGLRPRILEDFGVVAALRWYRDQLLALYPERHIEMDMSLEEDVIPKPLYVPIFRIAQEALNNVCKHSRAEWVDLSLSFNGRSIELVVSDDGVGMDLEETLQSSSARSLGLTSMRERAELTAGNFMLESTPGEGTVVRVVWTMHNLEKPDNRPMPRHSLT